MKTIAAALAFAAVAVAVPQASSTSLTPAEATIELYSALPSSIQALALTNEAAASTAIEEQFATGTPTWFTVLPSDVQSYFLAQQNPTVTAALTTGKSNSTASVTGKFSNSTTSGNSTSKTSSISLSTASLTTTAASSSKASAASSSSSGAAAIPTAIIGGGLAGVVGLVGMLAL